MAFDFSEFPVLITDRIILRELRKEDAADLLVFRGDAEEQRFNSEPLQTLEQSVALIEEVRGDYAAQRGLPWAVTLKSSGRVVGLFGYHHWDHHHRRTDIGYDLARELWGQGLATEALTAVIRFGFSAMGLNRIEAQTIADNERSTRLLGVSASPGRERGVATGTTTAPSTTERFTVSSATAERSASIIGPSVQPVGPVGSPHVDRPSGGRGERQTSQPARSTTVPAGTASSNHAAAAVACAAAVSVNPTDRRLGG